MCILVSLESTFVSVSNTLHICTHVWPSENVNTHFQPYIKIVYSVHLSVEVKKKKNLAILGAEFFFPLLYILHSSLLGMINCSCDKESFLF